jgi:outer membrane protein
MHRILILFGLLLIFGSQASAQKFGYVDMEFIMSKLPEYATAQAEIDKLSEN